MVWSALLAVAATTLLALAADPGMTLENSTISAHSPLLKYSAGWKTQFATMYTASSLRSSYKSTTGGSMTVDFVGSAIYVWGYFGIPDDTTSDNTTTRSFSIRMDNSTEASVQSGVMARTPTLLHWAEVPPGRHTAEIYSAQGGLAISHLILTMLYPVNEDAFDSATDLDYALAETNPVSVKSALTTTGKWSAKAVSGQGEYEEEVPFIKSTERDGSFSLSLGGGNDAVEIRGNLGDDHGAFQVTIEPPPYLAPSSTFESTASAPELLSDTTLYYATLERDKEYTMTVTNKGADSGASVLEVISIGLRKNASMAHEWNPQLPNTDTGATNQTDDAATEPETTSDTKSGAASGVSPGAVAGGVVAAFVAAAGIATAIFFYMRRKQQRKRQQEWEESRDPGGKLDIDSDDDNVTPFMGNSPNSPLYAHSMSYGGTTVGTGSQSGPSVAMSQLSSPNSYYGGPQSANTPYLHHLAGAQTTAVGALPVKGGMPMDQPAPQVPQDTDAGPMTNDMIPPSYDPSWAGGSSSRLSTATSSDASSPDTPTYQPNLSAMEELDEPAGGSSSWTPPVSSWPRDRKDPLDFM